MLNILVVGIGGIGGFFGGLLSRAYENSDEIAIHFLARGQNLSAIEANGLHVTTPTGSFITRPKTVTSKVPEHLLADYIILCTKSYDLEETIASLKNAVGPQTVLVPLLNGVDSRARIQRLYPENLVTDGCANIITRLTAPGYVENFSAFKSLHMGVEQESHERLDRLYQILYTAGVDVTLTPSIKKAIWSKFLLISTAATATSYFNKTFGEIKKSAVYTKTLRLLVHELLDVARTLGIDLPPEAAEKTWAQFVQAPDEATTSMHTDFLSEKGVTELESLTGYVVREAHASGVAVPTYENMYRYLSNTALLLHYKGVDQ
ncbi:ketopantoate reductase family protein [Sphingobacterium suaedae]|uniref:2-dehydropantoate 2-reductase n=1 Tax=Sphingobacterium suaedae TaxID=1686402 RepID=A0ABW5KCB7_9SPHI